ncbi:MAG: hypothetical protein ACYC5J_18410 [Chloroflexota bacterium]
MADDRDGGVPCAAPPADQVDRAGPPDLGEPLAILIRELRESDEWPELEVNAALLLGEILAGLGWSPPDVAAVLGFDPEQYARRRDLWAVAGDERLSPLSPDS